MRIEMRPVSVSDREEFLRMADLYYRELNPSFGPHENWKRCFFEKITSSARIFARWIVNEDEHLGFIRFGLEYHRFLPRVTGTIYLRRTISCERR